ncbi:MAG TPA: hypothetical protein VK716_01870 [Terracidiphilus sp.]|nr:hypothetical protein [Terracidiphilus sp.]
MPVVQDKLRNSEKIEGDDESPKERTNPQGNECQQSQQPVAKSP